MRIPSMHDGESPKERILVVDDELLTCELLEELLTIEGYEPVVCSHPKKALAEFAHQRFSLAFIDINLPDMNGLELASRLMEHSPSCQIVFITGYGTVDNAVGAIKLGAYDFLRKPFSIVELALCLERFQEWKALKERIGLAEQRYYQLVQNIPLIIYVLRRDYQLSFANQSCLSMLGYAAEEAINTPGWFLERIHLEDRERVRKKFDSAFESRGAPFSTECRMVHRKGHLIHTIVKSISYSQPTADSETESLEGIIMDITDRVFLEKAVVQREKLKTLGAISSELAHEIRNPLVSIGGFARRLEKKIPGFPEVPILLHESERLEKLVDQVRRYLEPVDMSPRECSVNEMVIDCMDLLACDLEQNRVKCQLDLDPHMQPVRVDPDVLRQVLINLTRNALAAVGKEGDLTIRTLERNQNAQIDFETEAPGIRLRRPELLFLSSKEGRESIGLPLCSQLVENIGGVLSFSEKRDHIVFTVSLPKAVLP
jgi:PAS domain S-box-containing protein